VTDSPEDREPPRLQDTTERSALPLPLPGSDEPAPVEPPAAADPPAPTENAAADTLPVAGEPEAAAEPEPEPEPADDPAPADKSPAVEEPSHDSPNGSPGAPPPFEPPSPALGAETAHEGPSAEVLIGAAFLGGLALALLIRRLGH
jgi:hypothetical protein